MNIFGNRGDEVAAQYKFLLEFKEKIRLNLVKINVVNKDVNLEALEQSIEPWRFLSEDEILGFMRNFKKAYNRDLYPFARKEDCDDFACLEKNEGDTIHMIHAFCSPGREERGALSFEQWYARALEDYKDHHWDGKR